jgi:hypothetical protein
MIDINSTNPISEIFSLHWFVPKRIVGLWLSLILARNSDVKLEQLFFAERSILALSQLLFLHPLLVISSRFCTSLSTFSMILVHEESAILSGLWAAAERYHSPPSFSLSHSVLYGCDDVSWSCSCGWSPEEGFSFRRT